MGGDGTIAIRAGKELLYARPGRRSLHGLQALATITDGEPVKQSLAVHDGTVTWRTTAGDVGSVPVPRDP